MGHPSFERFRLAITQEGLPDRVSRELAAANEKLERSARMIFEQAGHMTILARGLMDYSYKEIKIQRVDLNDLVNRTVEFVRPQNKFDGVEFEIALGESLPIISADPGQIRNHAEPDVSRERERHVLGHVKLPVLGLGQLARLEDTVFAQEFVVIEAVAAIAAEAAGHLPQAAVETLADVRYLGQSHEVTVPYRVGDGWEVLGARFHRLHEERNGFSRPGDPIELVTVRATATGTPAIDPSAVFTWAPEGPADLGVRPVRTADGSVEARVRRREGLGVGDVIIGPAVIAEREATTWIALGERAVVSETGALEVTW